MIKYDFTKKVVLVSGGTGALGQSVSLDFLKSGANVIITYVNENEVKSLESKFGNFFKNIFLQYYNNVKINQSNST